MLLLKNGLFLFKIGNEIGTNFVFVNLLNKLPLPFPFPPYLDARIKGNTWGLSVPFPIMPMGAHVHLSQSSAFPFSHSPLLFFSSNPLIDQCGQWHGQNNPNKHWHRFVPMPILFSRDCFDIKEPGGQRNTLNKMQMNLNREKFFFSESEG